MYLKSREKRFRVQACNCSLVVGLKLRRGIKLNSAIHICQYSLRLCDGQSGNIKAMGWKVSNLQERKEIRSDIQHLLYSVIEWYTSIIDLTVPVSNDWAPVSFSYVAIAFHYFFHFLTKGCLGKAVCLSTLSLLQWTILHYCSSSLLQVSTMNSVRYPCLIFL